MTARKYAGTEVLNKRYGYKKMHSIASYKMYGLDLKIYSDAFDEIVNIICKRYKEQLQTVITIIGQTGSAKSTLGIKLCMEVARKLKLDFDIEDIYIYSAKDVWDKLSNDKFNPICLYDEGAVSLNSKRSMSRDNVDIENAFTTLRDRGLISILCLPSIDFLDKAIRDVHVEYRINVYDQRNPLIRNGGKGFFDFNNKIVSKKNGKVYWNVLFAGVFTDLDDDTKKKYLAIKKAHQDQLIIESKERYYGRK